MTLCKVKMWLHGVRKSPLLSTQLSYQCSYFPNEMSKLKLIYIHFLWFSLLFKLTINLEIYSKHWAKIPQNRHFEFKISASFVLYILLSLRATFFQILRHKRQNADIKIWNFVLVIWRDRRNTCTLLPHLLQWPSEEVLPVFGRGKFHLQLSIPAWVSTLESRQLPAWKKALCMVERLPQLSTGQEARLFYLE